MPTITTPFVRRALAAMFGAAAVLPALATPTAGPLRQACPGIDEHLQAALYKVVHAEGEAAHMHVRLTLRGQRIVAVHTDGGPDRYHRAVRKALQNLHCTQADADATQTVDVNLRFIDPWGRAEPAGPHLAQGPAASAAARR
jgi:hypothetical protein